MNWHEQAFLLGHDLIGSRLRGFYREFLALPRMSRAQVEELRANRLENLLRHATANVPFYRDRVSKPDLAAFPVLRKEAIHEHFLDFMEPSLREEYQGGQRKRGYSWVEVKTGGSTGTPTTVIHDANFRDWGRASRLFSQALCGFPIGTPFFMLWGSMRDISEARDSTQKRILNRLLQVHPMNAFLMDDARMRSYLEQINCSRINHLMAYVDAAQQLARFATRAGMDVRPLKSIMACAGTVTDGVRSDLKSVFGAKVHNKYGSRECADMACEDGDGTFYTYSNGVILEIVDEQGNPVPDGTSGRILVTLLHNLRFPIIRYEIGDVGALDPGEGSLPLRRMRQIEGRTTEFVTSTAGAYVSPVYIRHIVGVMHNPSGMIERFQFVQENATRYRLDLQADGTVGIDSYEKTVSELRKDLLAVIGPDADLSISRVEQIPLSESGKFLYVRNLHRA